MPHAVPAPPIAPVEPTILTAHQQSRTDPYHWLRDRTDPRTTAYLQAENQYTEDMLQPVSELREQLYEEMLSRIKQTDLSVPERIGPYLYYSRTEEGQQYAIYCRRRAEEGSPEEVLLDANVLAEGHEYFRIGSLEVSPDHQLLAYSTDTVGDEAYTVQVKELASGGLLPDRVRNVYYGLEWANDNRTFFYTVLDAAQRPYRVLRHILGEDSAQDVLLHEEQDERFHLSLHKTRSQAYVMVEANSFVTSETRYLLADQPHADLQVLFPRQQGVEYSVEHHGQWFLVRINDTGLNFRLVRMPIDNTERPSWQELLPHNADCKLESVDAFRRFLVVEQREFGMTQLAVLPADNPTTSYRLTFPEPVFTVGLGGNPEFDTDVIRFVYQSLITPSSVYDYNLETRERTLLKQQDVLGGYDPSQYVSERVMATADDGTRIPISLVYRRGLEKDGDNPLYLYGYGSYGASMDPAFSSSRLSLLDRGFIYAIAHIRGGSEMGKAWHDAGRLMNKRNTFTDFIACAEKLVAERYTQPGRLVAMGGSAGGLLMGSVANLRPDLFHALVAHVPFVDVLNTAQDPSLPLTVLEYDEWGDSNEEPFFRYIQSYSPYDNVTEQAYPHLLVTAGLNDPRVSYWEPAKWVAKLRAANTSHHLCLLKTNMGGGHFGASGRYERLKEMALEYAFLLYVLGRAGLPEPTA